LDRLKQEVLPLLFFLKVRFALVHRFEDPIPLPSGQDLVTLKDTADYWRSWC
jgi:hypothetical protein